MTTKPKTRYSGPHPWLRGKFKPDRACTIAIQALCRGPFDWRVQGVTGAVDREGQAHIALRYGRILIYLEDRAALEALVDAVEAAYQLGDEVYGPAVRQAFDQGLAVASGGDMDTARPEAARA